MKAKLLYDQKVYQIKSKRKTIGIVFLKPQLKDSRWEFARIEFPKFVDTCSTRYYIDKTLPEVGKEIDEIEKELNLIYWKLRIEGRTEVKLFKADANKDRAIEVAVDKYGVNPEFERFSIEKVWR